MAALYGKKMTRAKTQSTPSLEKKTRNCFSLRPWRLGAKNHLCESAVKYLFESFNPVIVRNREVFVCRRLPTNKN